MSKAVESERREQKKTPTTMRKSRTETHGEQIGWKTKWVIRMNKAELLFAICQDINHLMFVHLRHCAKQCQRWPLETVMRTEAKKNLNYWKTSTTNELVKSFDALENAAKNGKNFQFRWFSTRCHSSWMRHFITRKMSLDRNCQNQCWCTGVITQHTATTIIIIMDFWCWMESGDDGISHGRLQRPSFFFTLDMHTFYHHIQHFQIGKLVDDLKSPKENWHRSRRSRRREKNT